MEHRKLNRALIAKARKLASRGLPLQAVAAGIGVHKSTLSEWLNRPGDELERELAEAIHEGQMEGAEALLAKLAGGDGRDAQWLLTHCPAWRDTFSDQAAVRREVLKVLELMVRCIRESELHLDDQRDLLLRMQASGITPQLPPADASH